ncbi:MAG: TonB-dependent receptor [Verrucomicrobiota bacterium]
MLVNYSALIRAAVALAFSLSAVGYAFAQQNASNEPIVQLERFVTGGKTDDPIGLMPTEPVDSIFGLKKSLMETPRAVTTLSDDLMLAYGIETALDVTKLVPSTFTTSIFGINGNVNIRGIPSDTYFRAMKRLENTQIFPSPISAMSRLDVVRGPPSPIYGPGKVGGYTNFVPKSARASTGKYLDRPTGKATTTFGSYNKVAGSFEVGGPSKLFGRPGGYYIYLNGENNDTYYDDSFFHQAIIQSSFDFRLNDRWRTEFGQMYQYWAGTEVAGWTRFDQNMINTGEYKTGRPLRKLDTDGDGLVSTGEVNAVGPLVLTFAPGTPAATVLSRLNPNFLVDPATIQTVKVSRHANTQSPGDGGQANIYLGYFDLIGQITPDLTLSNKVYAEYLHRYKWSRASPFAQDTASFVFENKIVLEQEPQEWTRWLRVANSLALSWRAYDTYNVSGPQYSDIDTRPDMTTVAGYEMFALPLFEPDLAPWNTGLKSSYENLGLGLVSDFTVHEKANFVFGLRQDIVAMDSRIPMHVLTTPGQSASNTEEGFSWSVSGSYEIAKGVRPYATYAKQETLIIGIDGGIGVAVVPVALNGAEMREVGVKTSLLNNKLFASVAGYRQTRTSFSADTGQVLSTLARGIEFETRYIYNRHLSITAGATWQKTVYSPLRVATVAVNPAFFGITEPWLYYAGKLQTNLGAEGQYAERSGYPDKVVNLNVTYLFTSGFGINLSTNYQASVPTGRIKLVTLPDALLFGGSLVYDQKKWAVRLTMNNIAGKKYFTPNSVDSLGEIIVLPAAERTAQVTFTYKF